MQHPLTGAGCARRRLPVVVLLSAVMMLVLLPSGLASAASPCPADSTYNTQTRMCEAPPRLDCPDGFTLTAGGRCVRAADVTCPPGTQRWGNLCVHVASPDCRDGRYDAGRGMCYTEYCGPFSCSRRYYTPVWRCAPGFTYNSALQRCAGPATATCTRGTLSNGRCEVPATPTCATGFTPNSDVSPPVCQAPPTLRCPEGFTLTANGRCLRAPTFTCPSGTQLAGNVCVHGTSPYCRSGFYDPIRRLCYTEYCGPFTCSRYYSTPEWRCSAGFIYNSGLQRCERPATAKCPQGILSNGRCEVPALPACTAACPVAGSLRARSATIRATAAQMSRWHSSGRRGAPGRGA